MKKILIATLFVLFILPSIGQDSTKVNYVGGGGGYLIDSFTVTESYGGTFKPTRDTIPVIMLICDTSHYFRRWDEIKTCQEVGCTDTASIHKWAVHSIVEKKEDRGKGSNGPVYWMVGYQVREVSGYSNEFTGTYLVYHGVPFYRHIEYMGEDKKPLLNKIVWMAKETK